LHHPFFSRCGRGSPEKYQFNGAAKQCSGRSAQRDWSDSFNWTLIRRLFRSKPNIARKSLYNIWPNHYLHPHYEIARHICHSFSLGRLLD
jgi:hypothetical protein